jgi:glycosyltransferase involved in cell wall biosynthesis
MSRPHITVVNYYSVFPFNNGGKLATRDFYKALSEWFDITVVCLSGFRRNALVPSLDLTQHLKIISLTCPGDLEKMDMELQREYQVKMSCEPTYVMSIVRDGHHCSEIVKQLCEISKNSSIIIAEHAYTYHLVRAAAENRADMAVWYRAQNVEYDYKCATWGVYQVPNTIYDEVFELEKECCCNSDLILTITESDAKRFHELYDVADEKMLNISAGYDAEAIRFVLPSERRAKAGSSKISGLYISSSAQVAVDAANQIAEVARDFPDIVFNIAGSVGTKMNLDLLPSNVNVLGFISDAEKSSLLETCDFALNPIVGGSGLNIKMLEYFASGIPVICTEFGARGITVKDSINCIITEKDALSESIHRFSVLSAKECDNIASNAYNLYLNSYTWRNCAMKVISYVEQNLSIELRDNFVLPSEMKIIQYIEQPSFIPDGRIYIYGAGEWGRSCLSFLQSRGVKPIAFIDKDEAKWGKQINDISIQCSTEEIVRDNDCIIIFALANFTDPIKDFLAMGLKPDHIVIGMYGIQLFRLSDGKGCVPYHIDIDMLQMEVGL